MGGFFPGRKYGGPPVSIDNFCSLMKENAECYIITHNHDMGESDPYVGIGREWVDRGNAKVKYLTDKEYGYKMFSKAIKELNPNYIYLQGLFQSCVLPSLWLSKKSGIEVVLAPRGELCAGAFKKKYKKLPYITLLRTMGFLKNALFQSTSMEETDAIRRYLHAKPERIFYLSNIPSIPSGLSKRKEKKQGAGRFVYISRIHWKKNLLGAITYLKDVKGTVSFDIFGPKENMDYWNECEEAIKKLPTNIEVNYKGVIGHEEVHETFNQYDAFLFPTFSENYGHVIAEALVTGCIPIISDQTPWTDMNNAGAGWALSLEDEKAFVNAIQRVIDYSNDDILLKRNSIVDYLAQKFQLEELKQEYLKVFS